MYLHTYFLNGLRDLSDGLLEMAKKSSQGELKAKVLENHNRFMKRKSHQINFENIHCKLKNGGKINLRLDV